MNTPYPCSSSLAIFRSRCSIQLALLCLAFLSLTRPTPAAVTEAWVHRYNNVVTNPPDKAFKVVSDAAGDFIVVGSSHDSSSNPCLVAIKYSGADGTVIWQKRYKGSWDSYEGEFHVASPVAVDGERNVVVSGSAEGVYFIAKLAAADGAILWEKEHKGVHQAVLAIDGSGNIAITASSVESGPDWSFYTAKYAPDGAILWERRGPFGWAEVVAVDVNGDVLVTGTSYVDDKTEFYTAKYAARDGALVWEKYGPLSWPRMMALAVDSSGNAVINGKALDGNLIVKYAAADGAVLWKKSHTGGGPELTIPVVVDGSGNVIVAKQSWNGESDYLIEKYAATDGALIWEKRHDSAANGWGAAYTVAVDNGGNIVVAGCSSNGDNLDYCTAKYAAADGMLLWEERYNSPANEFDYCYAMALDAGGNAVVTGFSGIPVTPDPGNYDFYTAKYSSRDGSLMWEKLYNGPTMNGSDTAHALGFDGNGNVVVTGFSHNPTNTYLDTYTAKYAKADGALLWAKRAPTTRKYFYQYEYEYPRRALAVDGSGNVLVTGTSENDGLVAKYAAADGGLVWENDRNAPVRKGDYPVAISIDQSGNVVVAGTAFPGGEDYYTAKYAASDGMLLWEKRFNGPANGSDSARAVAVDPSGNVVVTGISFNGFNFDFYTAKYDGASGALVWEKRYNGPANGQDYPSAVTVDSNGNVVVTGFSYASNVDSYTAKYAATDGALLWEKRYNGPANSDDYGGAVAVDTSGNVFVTGFSFNGSDNDYYTAKYAVLDGALLWEKRFSGPTSSGDFPRGLAVDSSGNVLVTGISSNGTNDDYHIVKYAAADGALLLEKRYNGPGNGVDNVAGLAIGPNGMIAITGSSQGSSAAGTTYDYATIVYQEVSDPPAVVGFTVSGVSIPEFELEAKLEVKRTGNLNSTVTVQYSATPTGGSIPDEDYVDVSGVLTFAAGQVSQFIHVPIVNDGEPELTQGVRITLSNPSAGAQLGIVSCLVQIIDNDNQTPVGPLLATVNGSVLGDWSRQNIRWGQGFPAVSVNFDTDETVTGVQRQSIWDNEFVRGSSVNDQPDFTKAYTTNLRVNGLVANTGTVKLTYNLAFATQLIDLMVLDVDDQDVVRIECRGIDGTTLSPDVFQIFAQGDLSKLINAIGRPPLEPATPPIWNPAAGTLTAAVLWNENRSYTILRPSVPLTSITLTFTGKRPAPVGDWGSHIYAALWATPRPMTLAQTRSPSTGDFHLQWPSLPGVTYRILRSSDLWSWIEAAKIEGAAVPQIFTEAILPGDQSALFFRIQRW
ncbi:MAG TPA: PQQ-binding-like beta-propeller repeat protein [Verrucomicrobiae bacterium]|nr:PQQ-binding-like beta-propeller repeat protein [Verrucomicrobiae bacterium]